MKLEDKVKRLRRYPTTNDPRTYVRCYSEKDVLNQKIVNAWVMILRTRGCKWARKGGCTMCGYISHAANTARDEDIIYQFTQAMKRYNSEPIVKLYTSGSFLDTGEVSEGLQLQILSLLSEKAERVIVESRPEFVKREKIEKLRSFKLELALGLESSNDEVLRSCVNKGFSVKEYLKAAKILGELSIPVKTYVLIKPPFLAENLAIEDAVISARFASKYSQEISFNPVNVQRNTLVEFLYKRREYRPPWLWSIVKILKRCKPLPTKLICSLAGAGTRRGAHNCGQCDKEILERIRKFSLIQDSSLLDYYCECKEEWLDLLELERVARTANLI